MATPFGDWPSTALFPDNPPDLFVGPPSYPIVNIAVPFANRPCLNKFQVGREVAVSNARFGIGVQSGNVDVGIYDASLNRLGSTGSVPVNPAGVYQSNSFLTPYSTLVRGTSGLIGYWRMGETAGLTGITNYMGAEVGPTGSYQGTILPASAPGLVVGDPNGAMFFDGVDRPSDQRCTPIMAAGPTAGITVSWIMRIEPGGSPAHSIFNWGNQVASPGCHVLYFDTSFMYYRWTDGTLRTLTIPWPNVTGTVYQCAFAHDFASSTYRWVVNGVEVAAGSTGFGVSLQAPAGNIFWPPFQGVSNQFAGVQDEVAIWNRALSLAEVQAIHAVGAGTGAASVPPVVLTPGVPYWAALACDNVTATFIGAAVAGSANTQTPAFLGAMGMADTGNNAAFPLPATITGGLSGFGNRLYTTWFF